MTTENTLGLLAQSLFVLGPLSVLRILGLRWGDASVTDAAPSLAADRPPLQFTLRSLFAWTTALAIVLGTLKWAVRYEFIPLESHWITVWIVWAVFGALSAVVAFVSLWAALGSRWLFGRLVSVAAILVLAAVLPWQFERTREGAWIIITLFGLQTLLLFGSLLVLRVAGYRLRFVRKKTQVESISGRTSEDH